MKAITIIQPWATLVALGEKKLETRSWPTSYRGPLAIHAGAKVDRQACAAEPFCSILAQHGYAADNLPTSAVVATCLLTGCLQTTDRGNWTAALSDGRTVEGTEYEFGCFSAGWYAWTLEDVISLAEPVAAKGKRRLWEWEQELD